MANGNKSRDRVLSETTTNNLNDVFEVIKVLLKKRFAFNETGHFVIDYTSDCRLITLKGPTEKDKYEDETYSIFITRDS